MKNINFRISTDGGVIVSETESNESFTITKEYKADPIQKKQEIQDSIIHLTRRLEEVKAERVELTDTIQSLKQSLNMIEQYQPRG